MNILGKRYFFFVLSLIIILPGLIVLFTGGLPLSIDFTGGSLLEVTFTNASPEPAEIIALYEEANIRDVQVQTSETRDRVLERNERRRAAGIVPAELAVDPQVPRGDEIAIHIGEAQVRIERGGPLFIPVEARFGAP